MPTDTMSGESKQKDLIATRFELEETRSRILAKIGAVNAQIGLKNPKVGDASLQWNFCAPNDWVSGFWCGQLWLGYQQTGDPVFRNAAQLRRPFFQAILDNHLWQDHDLGFQFMLSAVADYTSTGDPKAREMGLRAAEALRASFQPLGGYIKAWSAIPGDSHEWVQTASRKMIIDSLQNISLLLWAHRQNGVRSFYDVAMAHAQTSADLLVRDDFSTFYTYDFDPETQQPLQGSTHQGFADNSCWARGQAWAIQGFAQTGITSGRADFVELAAKLADFVLAHLPEDGVPEWDYKLSGDAPRHRDSSAGAITAAGLFLLASALPENRAKAYRTAGLHMLKGLMVRCDITENPQAQGLLDEGAYWVRRRFGRNMLPYGDYYYFEAVLRALGHSAFFW